VILALALIVAPVRAQPWGDLWGTDGPVDAIAVAGNTIYIGGSFSLVGPSTGGGVALDAESATPAGPFPKIAGTVSAVVADGMGGWFVGGTFTGVGGLNRRNLAHILAGGCVADWHPDPDNGVAALALDGQTLYIGGTFSGVGGAPRSCAAAIDARTGRVLRWNPNPTGIGYLFTAVNALAVAGEVVLVGGDFDSLGGQQCSNLGAVDKVGGTATAWRPQPDYRVKGMLLHGGLVYVGGNFLTIGGQSRQCLASVDVHTGRATTWNPVAGSFPSSEDAGPFVGGFAVTDSCVYVVGHFTSIGGQLRGGAAQLDLATGAATPWNPNPVTATKTPAPFMDAVAVVGTSVYLGGAFTQLGGAERYNVAAVDARTAEATSWSPVAGGAVHCLAASGRQVFAGGTFTILNASKRRLAAALDATTGQLKSWNPKLDGSGVYAIAAGSDGVFLGGVFWSASGQARGNLAAVSPTTGQPIGWLADVAGQVNTLAVSDTLLYIGGTFRNVGGATRSNLAAVSTGLGQVEPWNPASNDAVLSLAVGKECIYVGGWFTSLGGKPREHVGAIDPMSGLATDWNPASDEPVNAIAMLDSIVYLGGSFNQVGGTVRHGFAAVGQRVGYPTPWWADTDGPVFALATSPSTVYLGGAIDHVGGVEQVGVAALDVRTGSVKAWDPQLNGVVLAMIPWGDDLLLAGSFTSAGTQPRGNVAIVPLAQALSPPNRGPLTELAQNAPNPTGGTTVVTVRLASAAIVSLSVYDLQGRRMADPIRQTVLAAGEHAVSVETRGWAPGVYLYRVFAAGQTMSKKMLVVK
jgi:hypothetical protein